MKGLEEEHFLKGQEKPAPKSNKTLEVKGLEEDHLLNGQEKPAPKWNAYSLRAKRDRIKQDKTNGGGNFLKNTKKPPPRGNEKPIS